MTMNPQTFGRENVGQTTAQPLPEQCPDSARITRTLPENSVHILTVMTEFQLTIAQSARLLPGFGQRMADYSWNPLTHAGTFRRRP